MKRRGFIVLFIDKQLVCGFVVRFEKKNFISAKILKKLQDCNENIFIFMGRRKQKETV